MRVGLSKLANLWILAAVASLCVGLACGTATAAEVAKAAPGEPGPTGIVAAHPGDAGIRNDPAVIFADDFESWSEDGTKPPERTWTVHRNPLSRTRVIAGAVSGGGVSAPGSHVLEIACWRSESVRSSSGGLEYRLGNYNGPGDGRGDGYDELYVRYSIKLDEGYHSGCHGSNLGGRGFGPGGNHYWVGQAAVLDVGAADYFFSGLQPYAIRAGRHPDYSEMEYGFYSYHLDKPDAWGERFAAIKPVIIRPGEWHCVERHMKLNSVDADVPAPAIAHPTPPAEMPKTLNENPALYRQVVADRDRLNAVARHDGLEELWVDGQLTIRQPVRYRRDPKLHIAEFTLEQWYGALPAEYTPEHPIKVYYDNVVIARRYIGPIHGPDGR